MKLLLPFLLIATCALPALAGESAVIPLTGHLGRTQADRTAAEIERLSAGDCETLLLDLALDSVDDQAALDLAKAVAAAPNGLEIAVLVSRPATGGAVAIVFQADRSFMLPQGRLGPVSRSGEVRQRVSAIVGQRGIRPSAFQRLLDPPGVSAEEALQLGLIGEVCVARAEVFEALDVRPTEAEEYRPALPVAPRSGTGRVPLQGPFEKVFLIPIDREIDATLAASLERRVSEAIDAGADLILFEVDSPGGMVSAAMDIGDLVFSCKVKTGMLIFRSAYSAAALISLAGNTIIMGEGGDIGDCQPISIGPEGYQVLGEKIQSPLRALFRKFADRNGYPIALAEAMVTEEMVVEQVTFTDGTVLFISPDHVEAAEVDHGKATSRKIVVAEGKLLTMHAKEAFEFGFCGEPVKSRAAAFARLSIEEGEVTRLDESWAEETSRFLLTIKILLFFGGITALYMELKVPGFGVPGAIALICFALFFSASAISGISTGLEVVLFMLGVLLLLLEIFVIPGFGVAGIGGFLLLLISLYMASEKYPFPTQGRDWGADVPLNWLMEFAVAGGLSIIAIVLAVRFLPGTELGRRVILAPAGPTGSLKLTGSGSAVTEALAGLAGKRGIAVTDLRPAGRIEIGEEPVDAVTEGSYIERGATVRVIRAEGNRIVVEEA